MQIPEPISASAARWGVTLIEPADPHGVAWFAMRDGEHVVIKHGDPSARMREALALQGYDRGAARLIEHDHDNGTLLVERLLLGYDLMPMSREDDDQASRVIADVMVELHAHQRVPQGLPPLGEIAEAFDTPPDPRLPAMLVDQARRICTELLAEPAGHLLHGDLHHGNVLRDGHGWRAIDPHGWIGDPAFDAAAMMANPRGITDMVDARGSDPVEIASRARRRIDIVCEATGYDRDRVTAWAFVGGVIAELWLLEDHGLVHGAPRALALGLAPGL